MGSPARPRTALRAMRVMLLALGVFWFARGAQTLLLPGGTATFLKALLPDTGPMLREAALLTGGAAQLLGGVMLLWPRGRLAGCLLGGAVSASMLAAGMWAYPHADGIRCDCLLILGMRDFGVESLLFLAASACTCCAGVAVPWGSSPEAAGQMKRARDPWNGVAAVGVRSRQAGRGGGGGTGSGPGGDGGDGGGGGQVVPRQQGSQGGTGGL
jgi:hypothetical protein